MTSQHLVRQPFGAVHPVDSEPLTISRLASRDDATFLSRELDDLAEAACPQRSERRDANAIVDEVH